MIVPFSDLVRQARASRAAVGAFTCYDVTMALGVLRAARLRDAATILLVSEGTFRLPEGPLLIGALVAVGDQAPTPCSVQLDHASDESLIASAVAAGVGAVMADGSRLPAPGNADLVRRVGMVARVHGVGIEAELGHVEGDEDVAAATAAGKMTDPDEAGAFVAEIAPDCLAVSIGNVHGAYATPPALDWERLSHISERVGDVPLSLHGASGLPESDLRRAIELGVCKININTELRSHYMDELARRLPDVRSGGRLLELQTKLIDAVARVVDNKLEVLEGR